MKRKTESKIEIKITRYHIMMKVLSIITLIGTIAFLVLSWSQIPDKIPSHYNALGVIDRWGGKSELWLMVAISVLIYVFITVLEKYPQIWNTGVKITEENRSYVYQELMSMIVTVNFVVVLTFAIILIYSALILPLPKWFLPLDMVLVFGPLISFLIRIFRKKK